MRRVLVAAVPLVLAGLLFALLLQREEPVRTVRDRDTGLLPGESLTPVEATDWPVQRLELPEEVFLHGRVFDPHGRPVRRAEVAVLFPRTYEMVFTEADGRYELPFTLAGKYLVEARLTLDLAAKREVIEVPADRPPESMDFHLEPAGHVHGEIVVGNEPLFHGVVDIGVVRTGGPVEWDLDTDCDNGFFNFFWAPPRHAPLRLIVRSTLGYMERPVELVYTGERLDVGRIALTRYPTVALRLRLPDGTHAREVHAGLASALEPARGNDTHSGLPGEELATDSRLVLQRKESRTERFVFWDTTGRYRVVREVALVLDQLQELHMEVRPGPFQVRRRLVDEHGDPVRARFAVLGGPETESGRDGFFDVRVPHGGVHTIRLVEIHDPELEWIHLPAIPDAPRPAVLLDSDDPRADPALRLDGLVLVVGVAPGALRVLADRPGSDDTPSRWQIDASRVPPGLFGAARRLAAGRYRWAPLRRGRDGGWGDPPADAGYGFAVADRGLTIVDAR